jgi:hypothetical protein
MEAQQFHWQLQRHLKMTNVGQHTQYAYTGDVEEILTFKSFEGFEKKLACEAANN